MSLKQDMLIANLPKNGYNIGKTCREVGYTRQSSRSGALYASLRKKIEKAYNPDVIKEDIRKARQLMLEKGEWSNYCRLLELQSKITGLTKEGNTLINANIATDKDLKDLANRANVTDNK